MGTPVTGTMRPLANGFFEAVIRVDDTGRRKGFALTGLKPKDEEAARERCTAMAQIAVRLRHAGHASRVVDLLKMGARARAGRSWQAILDAVETACTAGAVITADVGSTISFVDFAKEWTEGRLHKRWPDHVAAKDSDDDAGMLRKYVEPTIGDVRLVDFTLDHAEQIMASIPEGRSTSLRRHVAQFVRRVLALAVYPARHLTLSPIPRGWMPKVKLTRAMTYLYPDEDRALLACVGTENEPGVPLHRRLFFGVLAREGLRRDELRMLRWRDVDFERGHIALDRNKTDDPRSWALDPGVSRALKAWKERYCADAARDDEVFPEIRDHVAAELRADLKKAGVKRESLFERSDARRPIRVHDLRATFTTLALANGKTETWVSDRTGWRSSEMVSRYRRAARTWTELNLGSLASLDEAIPELSATHQRHDPPPTRPDSVDLGATIAAKNAALRNTQDAAPFRNQVEVQASQEFESLALRQKSHGNSSAPESATHSSCVADGSDPVDAALASALTEAAAAGRFDVVAQLARELDARRVKASAPVIDLATRRGKR
jgi:integrase